jgi:hypothetical protein
MSAEAQPLPSASSDETVDANGNPFVSTAGNGGGALGGVAGNANATTAENAADGMLGTATTAQQGAAVPTTLVPSPPQSPVLGFSDKAINKSKTRRGLFELSLSNLDAVTVASNGKGASADIENGKEQADEVTMTVDSYQELAGKDWNATKALNDLIAQRKQVKSDIDNCKAEKLACEDDSKKIDQEWKVLKRAKVEETKEMEVRLRAFEQIYKANWDNMGRVRQAAKDAAEKFEQTKNAMRGGPEAGASKR